MTEDLKTHLAQQIQRVDWKPLDPHARRAGLLVVDPALDLAEVGFAIASDDSARVQELLQAQQLGPITQEQMERWSQETDECFLFLIVQPYVLVQRSPSSDSTS